MFPFSMPVPDPTAVKQISPWLSGRKLPFISSWFCTSWMWVRQGGENALHPWCLGHPPEGGGKDSLKSTSFPCLWLNLAMGLDLVGAFSQTSPCAWSYMRYLSSRDKTNPRKGIGVKPVEHLFELSLGIQCHFCCILVLRGESLGWAHI